MCKFRAGGQKADYLGENQSRTFQAAELSQKPSFTGKLFGHSHPESPFVFSQDHN